MTETTARPTWALSLSENAGGLEWGLAIHRRVEPADWPAALKHVPADRREFAEIYLRGMAGRVRAARDDRFRRGASE